MLFARCWIANPVISWSSNPIKSEIVSLAGSLTLPAGHCPDLKYIAGMKSAGLEIERRFRDVTLVQKWGMSSKMRPRKYL